jgi:prepilin-type N-terminal cleavage/methylation domain-containing protein
MMCDAVNEKLTGSKGFTLIEIVIATFLFSVALLGIASLTVTVIKGNFLSKQVSTATALAQQKLEENINQGYVNLLSLTFPMTEDYGEIRAADGTATLFSGYKRVSDVQPVRDALNNTVANTLKLTVTVYRKRDNVSVNFYTIIAK